MTDDLKWFQEMEAMRDEPLDPELAEYLVETSFMGTVLKHPLVFQVPFMIPGLANKALAQKREALKESMAERNWHRSVWLHERPYRLHAFTILSGRLTNEEFWELAGEIWTDSENIWQNREEWGDILNDGRSYRHCFMSKPDRRTYKRLPDTLHVYRGCTWDLNSEGFSWTLDRERAEFFARRSHDEDDLDKVVVVGTVAKEHTMAYKSSREESEIIVPDPGEVRISEVVEV